MKIKGIYKITNTISNKYYIGSDSNISQNIRWSDHKSKLRRNKHYNVHMQNAWNKYGESTFRYEILETFKNKTAEELSGIEQLYLDKAKNDKINCYNIIFGVRNYTRKVRKSLHKPYEQILEEARVRSKKYYAKHREEIIEKVTSRYQRIKSEYIKRNK